MTYCPLEQLPNGRWYCPECDSSKTRTVPVKSIRNCNAGDASGANTDVAQGPPPDASTDELLDWVYAHASSAPGHPYPMVYRAVADYRRSVCQAAECCGHNPRNQEICTICTACGGKTGYAQVQRYTGLIGLPHQCPHRAEFFDPSETLKAAEKERAAETITQETPNG